jgi:hypothetical protein
MTGNFESMNKAIRLSIIFFVFIFSIACGLFLARFLIPVYFLFFSPLPRSLNNFYITIGAFSFLTLVLVLILFKKVKSNWGILVSMAVILLLGFGIPLFMLENNEMLWQEAVRTRKGPVYFVEFGEVQIRVLQYVYDLFFVIWNKVFWAVWAYIIGFLAVYIYLCRHGWRIRGVRIKS